MSNFADQIKQIGANIPVDTLLKVIGSLAPVVPIPGAAIAGELAVTAGRLIAAEKARRAAAGDANADVGAILDGIISKGEANEAMFLEDIARLHEQMQAATGTDG